MHCNYLLEQKRETAVFCTKHRVKFLAICPAQAYPLCHHAVQNKQLVLADNDVIVITISLLAAL